MNIVIACGRRFGLQVMQLCESKGLNIIAVIAHPDDTAIIPYAKQQGYKILDAGKVKKEYITEPYDLGINAYSQEYIAMDIIDMAALGWIGYHPSLLPRHRGPAAIEWALKQRDIITGGTIYWLDEKFDRGAIENQDWIWLDKTKTAKEVWDTQLMPLGVKLFSLTIDSLKKGIIIRKPQSEQLMFATSAPRINKNSEETLMKS